MSTTASPRRPRVPDWLRPLTRRTGEVQFGVLPGGPIVEGITTAEARLLAGLDGSRSLEATYREAGAAGVTRRRWRELLALVARLGVVVDAEPSDGVVVPRRGRDRPPDIVPVPYAVPPRVVVDGTGRVAAEIAAVASACGAAVVHGRAEVDRIVAEPLAERPDLVVLVGSPLVDPRRGNLWLRHGIPHLPVATAGPHTAVGPLVDGSPGSPCLWCLERHRADRDEAWPTVMVQAAPSGIVGPDPAATAGDDAGLSPGLGRLVAGIVGLLVSRVLAGDLPPGGVSMEVALPWPRMDHRRWSVHPLCPEGRAHEPPSAI